jgi:hypothetical protein
VIRTLIRRGLRIGVVVGAILFLIQVFRNPASKDTGSRRPSGPAAPPRRPQRETAATPAARNGIDTAAPSEPEAPVAPAAKKAAAKKASAKKAPAKKAPAKAEASTAAPTGATADTTSEATTAWVEPEAGGACPATHPVKVKLASGIFHVPGGLAYERTAPDRCYRDAAAAEADGFRPSKR